MNHVLSFKKYLAPLLGSAQCENSKSVQEKGMFQSIAIRQYGFVIWRVCETMSGHYRFVVSFVGQKICKSRSLEVGVRSRSQIRTKAPVELHSSQDTGGHRQPCFSCARAFSNFDSSRHKNEKPLLVLSVWVQIETFPRNYLALWAWAEDGSFWTCFMLQCHLSQSLRQAACNIPLWVRPGEAAQSRENFSCSKDELLALHSSSVCTSAAFNRRTVYPELRFGFRQQLPPHTTKLAPSPYHSLLARLQ